MRKKYKLFIKKKNNKNTLYSLTKTMFYIKMSHLAGKFKTTYNTKF